MADREAGFLDALRDAGLSVDRDSVPVMYGNHQIDGGRQAARDLLEHAPHLTAIFALNDLMARGALDAAHAAGRHVPEDLSVMGFDDIPFAALANPPLTTVSQRIRQLGEQAADLLLGAIDRTSETQEDPRRASATSVLLPNSVVLRRSTAAAPGHLPAA
jgi:DNA-binding LacI/PurR family transcriptional regulator